MAAVLLLAALLGSQALAAHRLGDQANALRRQLVEQTERAASLRSRLSDATATTRTREASLGFCLKAVSGLVRSGSLASRGSLALHRADTAAELGAAADTLTAARALLRARSEAIERCQAGASDTLA